MVTNEQLDTALSAWTAARQTAVVEQAAWADVMASYGGLIASLRANGHTWSAAKAEFDRLSNYHRDAMAAAWQQMDICCSDYQRLRDEYSAQ